MREKSSYCEKYSAPLEKLLEEYGVKYRIVGDGRIVPQMISFSVFNDSDVLSAISNHVHSKPVVTIEYSRQELESAAYLTIVPVKNNVTITNNEEAFQFRCKRKTLFGEERFNHKKQVKPLQIEKIPANRNTYIFASSTGFSEIFATASFHDVVIKSVFLGSSLFPSQ